MLDLNPIKARLIETEEMESALESIEIQESHDIRVLISEVERARDVVEASRHLLGAAIGQGMFSEPVMMLKEALRLYDKQ